ncbi:DNA replication terminus site-binding protein [Thalassolituus sp. LLYu03]|uniref:DNA replication terminus site-binding protein n=1 Tax=Thalassolituus sp. LLYu03 TaxID=3421656 RepID=UPI003D299BCA
MSAPDIVERFDAMMAALRHVRQLITSVQPPLWLPLSPLEESTGMTPAGLLGELITDVWYRDGQDGRETRSRHGLIAANESIMQAARLANERKDDFRTAVQQLQSELEKADLHDRLDQLAQRHASLRDSLHFSGLSRLHLKQCYRHLPVLEHLPLRVGFSWYAHGRSIKRLSVSEAEQKLLALGEDKTHIQVQLAKLAALPLQQSLAQVQTLAPVVRANLVYGNDAPRARQAMNAPLPLFVPGELLPEFNQIASEPPEARTRQRRGDQRISDEPYLPSIRAHLYSGV